jgi:glycosyltransferase involved in cell wall biosynthesis
VCVVIVDRTGGVDLASAAKGAVEGSGVEASILTVYAPMVRRSPRTHGADVVFGPGAWWTTIVRDALRASEKELVVFLEVSSLAAFDGAAAMAAELVAGDAGAVAARLLEPRGVALVFDRGTFDVGGVAGSENVGFVASSVPPLARPTLFFDRRAFAARRSALLGVGAPHDDLGDVLAEVDWGWRLWLAGHPVFTSASTSVVVRDDAPSARRLPRGMLRARSERATSRILLTTLEEPNLARALAVRALSGVEAAAADTHMNGLLGREPHLVGRPSRGETLEAFASPTALQSIAANIDEVAQQRERTQRERVLTDDELFERVGSIFNGSAETPEADALRGLIVPRAVRTRPVLLVLCSDDLGRSMAGPAIRAVEIARALKSVCDPVLAARRVDADATDLPCAAITLSDSSLERWLEQVDAVFLQGPVTDWFPRILESDLPVVIDLYDPMHLEALQADDVETHAPYALNLVVDQLRRGDFFVCASERQRDYWLGMLSALGRISPATYSEDPDARGLIGVVPFGIPAQPPARVGPGPRSRLEGIGTADPLFVWNGGLWDWFDPSTFVRAVDLARLDVPALRAYFMGTRRPGVPVMSRSTREVIELSDQLGLTGSHVFFNEWTPYAERQDVYLDATAVVSLHDAHLESRFSFRTRLLDCIWARVPVVCTSGDVLAALVEEEQLGLTAPPRDVEAVAEALCSLARQPALATRARAHLQNIAAGFTWDAGVQPLADWLTDPKRRLAADITLRRRRGTDDDDSDAGEHRGWPWLGKAGARLKLLVPRPIRQYVLGPIKRRLIGALQAIRSLGRQR